MTKVKISSLYNRHKVEPFNTTGDTMTKQAHKDECDINRVVKRYLNAGVNPFTIAPVQYGGETVEINPVNFHESMNLLAKANESFDALPSNIRKRFENSPSKLLAFLGDPSNAAEAVNLGLVNPPTATPQENPPQAPSGAPETA